MNVNGYRTIVKEIYFVLSLATLLTLAGLEATCAAYYFMQQRPPHLLTVFLLMIKLVYVYILFKQRLVGKPGSGRDLEEGLSSPCERERVSVGL